MPADPESRIVIVGAGQAGGSAAAFLRQFGHTGEILLIGAEPVPPYQRPPLSKAYLKGEVGVDALRLRPDAYYTEHRIALRLGETVTAIEPAVRRVRLGSGEAIAYDMLILATGSHPRALPLPGADLPGVLTLRSIADSDALKAALAGAGRLVIIGGGYIGLEAAASARAAGVAVTIVERESRVLARVASPVISRFYEARHRAEGVEILTEAGLKAIEGEGQVTGVRLADGRRIACEVVLVGVGAAATDALAREAGLACEAGILVDQEARTSDPAIFAIGDVTWRQVPLYDRYCRVESVGNAVEQAKQAAGAIAGRPAPAHEVPWFWSDQYDLKLQLAGLAVDADRLLVRGSEAKGKFAVFHLNGDKIRAVEAVNSASEFIIGKRLIGEQRAVDPDRLADVEIPMGKVAG
jgi:3-phenylpropionate/trans-cinnamate dioxygenase ferredoxin reductase subunit